MRREGGPRACGRRVGGGVTFLRRPARGPAHAPRAPQSPRGRARKTCAVAAVGAGGGGGAPWGRGALHLPQATPARGCRRLHGKPAPEMGRLAHQTRHGRRWGRKASRGSVCSGGVGKHRPLRAPSAPPWEAASRGAEGRRAALGETADVWARLFFMCAVPGTKAAWPARYGRAGAAREWRAPQPGGGIRGGRRGRAATDGTPMEVCPQEHRGGAAACSLRCWGLGRGGWQRRPGGTCGRPPPRSSRACS